MIEFGYVAVGDDTVPFAGAVAPEHVAGVMQFVPLYPLTQAHV